MPSFKIDSDGTVAGTKVYVEGQEITANGNVLDASIGVQGGYTYDEKTRPASVTFRYSQLIEENGGKSTKNFSYDYPKSTSWSSNVIPSKKDDSVGSYVGKSNPTVDSILQYGDKAKVLPTKDELYRRTQESLSDLLHDLQKEFGPK